MREEARTRRFITALINRSNPFTYLFIGMNLAMFALLWLGGGMGMMNADHASLVALGAKEARLIDEQGQYWRLVTSIFLHIGFLHIFFNNYALWIIGQEIERLYGSARFVVLYLVTGVVGSLASYFYKPEATSAGASGAIFGLFGVLATFAFKYRQEIPRVISRDIKRRVIPLIAINLGIGLMVPMIDNSAHIGGLITGMLLALVIPYKRAEEKATDIFWRTLQVVCLAVIALSIFSALRYYDGPPMRFKNLLARPGEPATAFVNGMEQATQALVDSYNTFAPSLAEQETQIDATRSIAEADRGLQMLDGLQPTDEDAQRRKERLRDLISRQKAIVEGYARERPPNRSRVAREEQELKKEFEEFRKQYQEWLPGYLEKYGLRLLSPEETQR